jgi:hypothetical protein
MPGTRVPPPTPEARAERRNRAIEELLDVRPMTDGPYGVVTVEVRNLRRQSHYVVYVPAYPDRTGAFCGCEDFLRRDLGTCKHVESAFLWLSDHPDARAARPVPRSTRLWAAIEQRARRAVPADTPPSRRLRYLGSALLP